MGESRIKLSRATGKCRDPRRAKCSEVIQIAAVDSQVTSIPLGRVGTTDEIAKAEHIWICANRVNSRHLFWVVHAFQKKSTQGSKTPKGEIDLVKDRLKRLKEM